MSVSSVVGAKLPVTMVELFIDDFRFGTYTYGNKDRKLFKSITISQLSNSTVQYDIELCYNPDTFSKGEANYFEVKLQSLMSNRNTVTEEDKSNSLHHNYIYLRFGYLKNSPYGGGSMLSPYYAGLITNATSSVSENSVTYKITAFGCDCAWDMENVTFLLKDIDVFAPLKYVFTKFLGDIHMYPTTYDFECDDLPSIAELAGYNVNEQGQNPKQIRKELQEIFDKVLSGDSEQTQIQTEVQPEVLTPGGITKPVTTPNFVARPINYIRNASDCLKLLVDFVNMCITSKTKVNDTTIKGKLQLCILPYVTSTNTKQKGTIYLCNLLNTTLAENYNFDYSNQPLKNGLFANGSKGKVKSWDCTYTATAKLYKSKIKLDSDSTLDSISENYTSQEFLSELVVDDVNTTDIFGEVSSAFRTSTSVKSSDRDAKKASLHLTKDLTKIQTLLDYPYDAQITVLGNPTAINLCKHHINVTVKVNGDKHHTSGKYIIVGVSHSISNGQFMTTYKLIKYTNATSEFSEDKYSELPKSAEERATM